MKYFFYLSLLIGIISCGNPQPQPIEYGKEQCHYCQMNIVDQQHASQLVTEKGKAYKYDAIECMLHDLPERSEQPIALYLVCDYNQPNTFIDAQKATFIISKEIPSPMGGNLSALSDLKSAEKLVEEKTGELYSWEALLKKYNQE